MRKIYFFIGTTAELIKLFPVIRELEKRNIEFKIITSGQTSMNFDEVSSWIKKTKPDIELPGKGNESSFLLFLIWAIRTLLTSPILLGPEFRKMNKRDIWFLVHGDTASSLIGAIVAKIFNLKLVHIESGLRSYDFFEPFPEELCRFLVAKLAKVHFCPNQWSLDNLSKESGAKINTFQNTFIESFQLASAKKNKAQNPFSKGKYFVLITHRQEHVIFGKKENWKMVDVVLRNFDKKMYCVFVIHVTTSSFLKSVKFKFSYWRRRRVKFLPRLSYKNFINLLKGAEYLVTDGGGNQEEAYYLGLPCLLLRKRTERIEGLGKNAVLAGNDERKIINFLKNYKKYRGKAVRPNERPSKIIADYLLKGTLR